MSLRTQSEAPSGRELSHRLGGANVAATEGECVIIKSNKTSSHAGSFRHGDIRLCRSRRATFLPEEGYIVPLQVRTYSSPKMIVLIEKSRYGNKSISAFSIPLPPLVTLFLQTRLYSFNMSYNLCFCNKISQSFAFIN